MSTEFHPSGGAGIVTGSSTYGPVGYPVGSSSPAVNTITASEINVLGSAQFTGISFYNEATVSGNVLVGLYSSTGALIIGSSAVAQSGINTLQLVPFTTPYQAAPGKYYVAIINSSGTATFGARVYNGLSCATNAGSFALPSTLPALTHGSIGPALATY